MAETLLRSTLALDFQPLPPGRLGEITHAALYWNRGGTMTLSPLRYVPDLHLLVMCIEGRCDYVDERGTKRVLVPGDVMLIPRGMAHAYRPTPGHQWSEIHVWMRGALPDLWWSQRFLGPGLVVLRAEPLTASAQYLCRIFAKPHAAAGSNDERIAALQSWIVRLKDNASPKAAAHVPWFAVACRELAQGSLRQPDMKVVAANSGVSYESFRKIFTSLAGISPGQFRVAAVIEQACSMLHGGKLTLREIAAHLEFSDEFHFSRTFRQRMGLAPSQYRAMALENRDPAD